MNKCRFLIKIQTHAKKFIAACQLSLVIQEQHANCSYGTETGFSWIKRNLPIFKGKITVLFFLFYIAEKFYANFRYKTGPEYKFTTQPTHPQRKS